MTGYSGDQTVYALVGQIAAADAMVSQSLTQFAGFLCDTDMVTILLDDDHLTLGSRCGRVQKLLKFANASPHHRHAPVDSSIQTIACDALVALDSLLLYRNRAVHDTWLVPTGDDPRAIIVGHRAKVFGAPETRTNRMTFVHVTNMLHNVAGTLSAAGFAIHQLRRQDREAIISSESDEYGNKIDPITMAEKSHRRLMASLSDLQNGQLKDWRWETVPVGTPLNF